jgi:hypothetical protein
MSRYFGALIQYTLGDFWQRAALRADFHGVGKGMFAMPFGAIGPPLRGPGGAQNSL